MGSIPCAARHRHPLKTDYSVAPEPTHNQIAQRAYELFEGRGGDHMTSQLVEAEAPSIAQDAYAVV